MAKTSKIVRNEQRRIVVARYAERRAELKGLIAAPSTPDAERAAATAELRRQPGTPARPGYATATPWTAGRAATCARSGSPGSGCASSRMAVTCPGAEVQLVTAAAAGATRSCSARRPGAARITTTR